MEQLGQNRDAVKVEITDEKQAQFDETSLPRLVIVSYYQVNSGLYSFTSRVQEDA